MRQRQMDKITIFNILCRSVYIYLLLVGIFLLSGCGAGRTLVLDSSTKKSNASTVNIVQGKSTIDIPDDKINEFHSKLSQLIYDENNFETGSDLTITYRFLQYNEGNQFTRWFWGGIGNAGEGTLTVEAVFSDLSGDKIARIQSEGKISSGFFGGDFSLAVQKAAEEIATFTVITFK
jgi:hypothetical protein